MFPGAPDSTHQNRAGQREPRVGKALRLPLPVANAAPFQLIGFRAMLTSVVASRDALSPADALVVLLTVETLLFAAFAVGAAFSETTEFGRSLPTSAETFARLAAAAITLVGIGGVAAWVDAYVHRGIHSAYDAIEAAAVLIGILSEMGLAWWTAAALKGS
jgi:hypothetical protein